MVQKHMGIDWDAITPACKECGTKSGSVDLRSLLCPACNPEKQIAQQVPPPAQKTLVQPAARKSSGPRTGIKMNGRKSLFDPEKIIELARDGKTSAEIAASMSCSESTVNRVLGKEGFVKKRGRKPAYDREKMKELRKEGKSPAQIADALGCSAVLVNMVLRDAGMGVRPGKGTRKVAKSRS